MNKLWGFHAGNPRLDERTDNWKNTGSWNFGPGLYITQSYDEVIKYKKGNRALWLVLLPHEAVNASDYHLTQSDIFDLQLWHPYTTSKVSFKEGMLASSVLAQMMNGQQLYKESTAAKMLKVMHSLSVDYDGDLSKVAVVFTNFVILEKVSNQKWWTDEFIASKGLERITAPKFL